MKFYDWLDALNLELEIQRYPNQNNRFISRVASSEIKEGAILRSTYGNGQSPEQATAEYIEQIKGKLLVIHAFDEKYRREYVVPTSLTLR